MIDPAPVERFDAHDAGNLLSRKTHACKLPKIRYGWERLSQFHGRPPHVFELPGAGCRIASSRARLKREVSMLLRSGDSVVFLDHFRGPLHHERKCSRLPAPPGRYHDELSCVVGTDGRGPARGIMAHDMQCLPTPGTVQVAAQTGRCCEEKNTQACTQEEH